MLRQGLSSLNELDIMEVKEAEDVVARDHEVPALGLDSFNLLDLNLAF